MDTHHRLHGRKRVLPRSGRVVDERLRNLNVLRKTRHQVDVTLAVTIQRRTELEMFLNRFEEGVDLSWLLFKQQIQIFSRQRQQDAGRRGSHRYIRRDVAD